MANLKNTIIDDNTSLTVPTGPAANRPTDASAGSVFYNTDDSQLEYYDGNNWRQIYDSLPKAKGGIWFDTEENGVPYRVHVFTTRGFAYTSASSAGELGISDNFNNDSTVEGESDQLSGGCQGSLTFQQALDFCHSRGVRLPTRQEIVNRVAEGTGCGFDSNLVWTCNKADQDGTFHWRIRGDITRFGFDYDRFSNSTASALRYVADVDPDRDDPVFLSDKFMFDYLKNNYPANFTGDKFVLEQGGEVEYLIVAGGGGGGPTDGAGAAGGGGGAGGALYGKTILQPGTYPIQVGEGGAALRSQGEQGEDGGNTTALGFTAIGGGGGGSRDTFGRNGGSGGGTNRTFASFGSGTSGQGFDGGGGDNNVSPSAGGGGGGATELGQDARTDNNGGIYYAGRGGNGIYTSIAGTSVFYAGGGGGGDGRNDQSGAMNGAGGLGGGGAGGDTIPTGTTRAIPGHNGAQFTGGGGGGSAGEVADGGKGGDGIVVIRYKKAPSFDTPLNTVTKRNLVFNADASAPGSFSGRRNDYEYWYELEQNIRGEIFGETNIENPGSNQAAPQFEGNDRYVRYDLGADHQIWGIEMWAYFDYAVPNDDTQIGGPTGYQTMWASPAGANTFRTNLGSWTSSDTGEAVHIWTNSAMTFNRDYQAVGWHHLFFRWNGSTYDIWIDGFRTRTFGRSSGGGHASLIEGLSSLDIGGAISRTYMFQGKIPVFRLYSGEISEDEILRNFNALRWRYDV